MFFPNIASWPYVVFDTETNGIKWWKDRLFSFSLTAPGGESWYYDIRVQPRALEAARKELPKVKRVVAHNMKFDYHFAREVGILLPDDRLFCTMIAAAVIDEHQFEYNLDFLAAQYTDLRKDTSIYEKLAALFGGKPTPNVQASNFFRAPVDLMSKYGMDDGRATNALYKWQLAEIEKQELQRVIDLEMSLLPAVIRMEHRGVRVDLDRAEEAAATIAGQIPTIQQELNRVAGFEVNPNPSGSIHKLFDPKLVNDQWVLNDGTVAQKTDAGKASIDADCLRSMKHPAASLILRLRKMKKVKDTFLEGHILGHHHNGVIHCNINQTKSDNEKGTGTGRFSINDPALQQIHKRDVDVAAVVRSIFIPDPGQEWLSIDWGQFEQRWFAHYVNSRDVIQRYKDDSKTDFYQVMSDLTGLPRSARYAGEPNAKQMTLASIFGQGPGALAQEMGLPYTIREGRGGKVWLEAGPEAKEVLDKFHSNVPGIKAYLENASSVAKSRGFVRTGMGRHIRFPKGMFTHKAGGLILQGTAADAMKIKIIEVTNLLKGTGASLMLTVHDELNISVPPDSKQLGEKISKCYNDFNSEEAQLKCRVPIISSVGVSGNWWDSCKD